MRRYVVVTAVVGLLALFAGHASAATPRILIFSGTPLQHQVVVANWQTIFKIFARTQPAPTASHRALRNRPSIRLSMFWGPAWNDFLRGGGNPRALRPRQADQFGTFYPAHGGGPALLDVWWGKPRVVPASVLEVLRSVGIPVRA